MTERFCTRPSPPTRKAVFIGAAQYRRALYRRDHPLAIPRVSLTFDLINAYQAISRSEYLVARKAADHELAWFHTPEYISAIKRAEVLGRVSDPVRKRHNLGTLENPFFDGLYSAPAHAAGASIQAAEAVIAGTVAFNPAGGMHHARADCAQGFCFFNDPVLAIMRLRRHGWRVLYVDIDAHHGDGVEHAFRADAGVMTLSLHMDTQYAYPFRGGTLSDSGSPTNGFGAINVPLPRGTHDAEYHRVFETVWSRALSAFAPDVVVLQAGTDIIGGDPLGKFNVSTQGFLQVVEHIFDTAPRHADGTPRLLVTGGGGYHPLLLARAWTGLWALISGRGLDLQLPQQARSVLRAVPWDDDEDEPYFSHLFESRLDAVSPLPVRPEIESLCDAIASHPGLQSQVSVALPLE